MDRRQLLAGIGAGVATASAGCVIGGAGPERTPPPADRQAVDETWEAGPTEPNCSTSGEQHYPFMNKKEEVFPAVPGDNDVETVEEFVQERIEFGGEVTLRKQKPARVAWRAEEFDVAERYGSDLYYVGWVGEVGGTHRLLIVVTEGGTRIVNYLNTENCPGG